jgi:hypothetical protein
MNRPQRINPMHSRRLAGAAACAALCASLWAGSVQASDVPKGIEQALATAQQEKKGVTLYVGGQVIGGGVLRIEPGQWVELKNQQFGRIVVRLDRIDGLAMP